MDINLEGIKISFLEKAIIWITSGEALDLAKLLVTQAMDDDSTSAEKRTKVLDTLREHLEGFSTVVLSILLEIAVLVIKGQFTTTSTTTTSVISSN